MASSTIIKREEDSESETALADVSLPTSRAPGSPAAASTTTRRRANDLVFGTNRLATGFTAEDTKNKLEETQARLSSAIEEDEELRGLQNETQEKANEIEASLKDIKKEMTRLQESELQKQRLLEHYNEEIEHRAKQIEESDALIADLKGAVTQLEARQAFWERRRDETLPLVYLESQTFFNVMTNVTDEEFQNWLERVTSARAANRPRPESDAVANTATSSTDDNLNPVDDTTTDVLPEEDLVHDEPRETTKEVSKKRANSAFEAAVVAGTECAADDAPRRKHKSDWTPPAPSSFSKKHKRSHFPEKYRHLPQLSDEMRRRFMNEGRCFRCHEAGHRKNDPVCPLFNY
ncbi:hypothetical protein CLCR_06059 [Cladophialophora carrionii]|uniref:Uncharacterized protein n=1 Tax=Cladophialophora carrionii TaxID=86049 RepID=A0A1C1C7I7_9EURO|nr:hypothetical protein CLCR_06059 [Cladophialophora carrionii]